MASLKHLIPEICGCIQECSDEKEHGGYFIVRKDDKKRSSYLQ